MWLSSAPSALAVVLLGICVGSLAEDSLVKTVFETLEKELDFFAEDYSSINVDGLFGLRLGQGQLKAAIRECVEQSCDPGILEDLRQLDSRLDEVSDSALPYVKESDEAYYQRFESTISKPYILPYTPTSFGDDDVTTGSETRYEEEAGDKCYSRIMGTYVENDKILPKCNITSGCWQMMTRDDTAAYFITHQLLYFIVVEHVGCRESVEKFMQDIKLFDIQKKFCRKIYEEACQLEDGGRVKAHRKDLFLEQTVLCGTLGFENFMRRDWIKMVLDWPDKKDGCFKYSFINEILSLKDDSDKPADKKSDADDKQKEQSPGNKSTMRKLLREKHMKSGCLSHTSGLGFGVLSTYFRYLLKLV